METNPDINTPIQFIELLGAKHGITLPDLVEREELALAWRDTGDRVYAQVRVGAAAIGLLTRLGRRSGVTYEECKCNPLVYGGKVYSYLRDQGATPTQVQDAGRELILLIVRNLAPREKEVKEKEDFS